MFPRDWTLAPRASPTALPAPVSPLFPARAEPPIPTERFTSVVARHDVQRENRQAQRAVLAFAGALLSMVGAVLAVGGYLSPLAGSAFYMFIGVGLILSGVLVARQHRAGAWTYMVVFTATLTWALRNIDTGTSLAVRMVGPAALLAILALLMPVLCQWRPRTALLAFAAIMTGIAILGAASLAKGPFSVPTAAVAQFLDAQTKGVLK